MRVLVTGGAGFIGSHTADALLARGYAVRILDNLQKPVHQMGRPKYLSPAVEFIEGDVRDRDVLRNALESIDIVYHFAAYQDYLPDFSTFFHVNAVGTALLYEVIVAHKLPIKKVIVASSQAVAGEGLYLDQDGNTFTPDMRSLAQLESGMWDIQDAKGRPAAYQATPEHVANPRNAYGMSKLSQESIALTLGRRYEIPSVAMRYSIVQGPRQSFYNAYSGACRIFCLSLYFDRAPVIYEDGLQVRDYVNITDVVDANVLVLDDPRADYKAFNVGGGRAHTVLEFYETVRAVFEKSIAPDTSGIFRLGDTRHIMSDISALRALGWSPRRSTRRSVEAYVAYLQNEPRIDDILAAAQSQMKNLNVLRKAHT